MASFLIKTASLAGLASVGGGIAAGSSSWFNPKEKPVEKPKDQKTEEVTSESQIDTPTSDSIPTQPVCIIYEAQDPKGNSGNRTFSKLLGKYGNRDEFFAKFGQDSGKPVSESSKTEINNECENKANKKNINGKVYLWWGKVGDKNTWIYALDLHNHDWDNDPKVEKEFSSTIPTIRA